MCTYSSYFPRFDYDQCSMEFRWQQRGLGAGALAGVGAGTLVGVGAGPRRGSNSLRDVREQPSRHRHLIARANTVCEVSVPAGSIRAATYSGTHGRL